MITTKMNKEYGLRLLGVGLLLLSITVWFLYDGSIAYPQTNQTAGPICKSLIAKKHTARDLIEKNILKDAFDAANASVPSALYDHLKSPVTANAELADSVEYATKILEAPVYSQNDINAQFSSAVIAIFFSGLIFTIYLKRRGENFQLTENELTRFYGFSKQKRTQTIKLDEISQCDYSKWDGKRILVVKSPTCSITLDAWHHEGITEIEAKLKEKIKPAVQS